MRFVPGMLTHDMIATGGGRWRCVDCGRAGTIAFISLVECDNKPVACRIQAVVDGDGLFSSPRKRSRKARRK